MPLNAYTTFFLYPTHLLTEFTATWMKLGSHYTRVKKPSLRRTDSERLYVYEASKVVKLTEAENGMVVAWAGGGG